MYSRYICVVRKLVLSTSTWIQSRCTVFWCDNKRNFPHQESVPLCLKITQKVSLPFFKATELRLDEDYVRWYSCIINSIVMIVIPTFVLIFTTYQVRKMLNTSPAGISDERSKARAKRNKSITRMLIGIILMFLICHTGKVISFTQWAKNIFLVH